jgi:hypothetical protein
MLYAHAHGYFEVCHHMYASLVYQLQHTTRQVYLAENAEANCCSKERSVEPFVSACCFPAADKQESASSTRPVKKLFGSCPRAKSTACPKAKNANMAFSGLWYTVQKMLKQIKNTKDDEGACTVF